MDSWSIGLLDYWMVGALDYWIDGLSTRRVLGNLASSLHAPKKKAVPRELKNRADKSVSQTTRHAVWFFYPCGIILLMLWCLFSACGKKPQPLTLLPFNGQSAYELLVKQCSFGPRVPDTPAHDSCRVFLAEELKKYAAQTAEQTFDEYLPGLQKTVKLTNIIASFNLKATQRILLCAHWDSRPWADQDSDTSKQRRPVLGANDGASGVAVLLEIAKTLKNSPPPVGVDIILFDGEDAGLSGQNDTYLAGSRYFARTKAATFNPMMGILLDMVGGAHLQLYKEINSVNYAGAVVDRVWNLAAQLGVTEFIPTSKHQVTDDHIPLLEAGIPVIDIIDFDYSYWHTAGDTPDKCSAASLEKVGRVVLAAVYNPEK